MTKAPPVVFSMKWRGRPVPKGRPRFNFNSGHTHSPPATQKFEKAVKKAVQRRWGKRVAPTGATLEVHIKVDRAVPLSWSKKRILEVLTSGEPPQGPGDLDNIAKSILDAMNGVIFDDDKQIAKLSVRREYASEDAFHIIIREAENKPAEKALIERVLGKWADRRKAKQEAA